MLCQAAELGDNWAAYNGDCCELVREVPSDSIGFSAYSPPFASLFNYSDNLNCMSNCADDAEFFEHYRYLVQELYRVMMPGRCVAVHCMNLPKTIQRDGVLGMRDFRGDIIRCHESCGFVYHSEVVIWKCPVVAVTRTKAIGLLHKQLLKDSSISRQGMPDYVVVFRKPGKNPAPISGPLDHYAGEELPSDTFRRYQEQYDRFLIGQAEIPDAQDFMGINPSIEIWQKYASPVWMDIRQGRVLNNFRDGSTGDEVRHLCPLQLDVIERCLQLWSKPGDTVLSPFMGVGSEGVCSINMDRKFMGFELKDSYFRVAVQNLQAAAAERNQGRLF